MGLIAIYFFNRLMVYVSNLLLIIYEFLSAQHMRCYNGVCTVRCSYFFATINFTKEFDV
jgi:hypothetical protein